jgi:hypothetical protein
VVVWLRDPYASGARTLGADLDLEGDELTSAEAIEVGVSATPVEEVLLAIVALDEAEATIGDELLDCSVLHLQISSYFSNPDRTNVVGPFEKEDASAKRAPDGR